MCGSIDDIGIPEGEETRKRVDPSTEGLTIEAEEPDIAMGATLTPAKIGLMESDPPPEAHRVSRELKKGVGTHWSLWNGGNSCIGKRDGQCARGSCGGHKVALGYGEPLDTPPRKTGLMMKPGNTGLRGRGPGG